MKLIARRSHFLRCLLEGASYLAIMDTHYNGADERVRSSALLGGVGSAGCRLINAWENTSSLRHCRRNTEPRRTPLRHCRAKHGRYCRGQVRAYTRRLLSQTLNSHYCSRECSSSLATQASHTRGAVVKQAGRELGVRYVLEGAFAKRQIDGASRDSSSDRHRSTSLGRPV